MQLGPGAGPWFLSCLQDRRKRRPREGGGLPTPRSRKETRLSLESHPAPGFLTEFLSRSQGMAPLGLRGGCEVAPATPTPFPVTTTPLPPRLLPT